MPPQDLAEIARMELARRALLNAPPPPPEEPVSRGEPVTAALTSAQNFMERFVQDPVAGAIQGAASLPFNVRDLISRARGQEPGPRPTWLTPQTTGQKAGFVGEQIGEFFLGGGLIRKIPGVARALMGSRLPNVAARTGVEALTSAGVTGVQTGGDVRAAGLSAAIDAGFTAAFGAFAPIMRRGSQKAMAVATGFNAQDVAHGFDLDNIFKHNLQGTVRGMAKKAEALRIDLGGQLERAVAQHGDIDIDVLDLFNEAVTEVQGLGSRYAVQKAKLPIAEKALLEIIGNEAPNGVLGLVDAQGFKQAIGELGAWATGSGNAAIEASAIETLANTYYRKLREALEVGAPEVIKINKALSEVIPIEKALIRQLPADLKKQLFELGELILISGSLGFASQTESPTLSGLATGTAGLLFLNRMMRSPTGGRGMRALSEPGLGPTVGRVTAGGVTAGANLEQ